MADLKAAVVEMLRQGMSEREVKSSLEELGVADADGLYSQAVASMADSATRQAAPASGGQAARNISAQPAQTPLTPPQAQQQAQPASFPRPKAPETPQYSAQSPATGESQVERELREIPASADSPEVSAKIDDAIALLRAIQEIDRKILETNRDILLRLRQ